MPFVQMPLMFAAADPDGRKLKQRIRRYQAFVARLDKLRIEADELGLTGTHNKLAEALRDVPVEIRAKDLD